MSNQDKNELNKYVDSLSGQAWKGLARAKYNQSRQKNSHRQAMSDAQKAIIETATKAIENNGV